MSYIRGSLPKGYEKKVSENPSTKTEDDRDELIFDLIQKRMNNEWERLRSVDGKASSLVGFVSVAVSFLLGTSSLGFFESDNFNPYVSVIFLVGIGILLIAIGLGLYGLKVRKWDAVPDVTHLLNEYRDKPFRKVLRKNAATMASSIMDLEEQINSKAKFVHYSWIATIVGLGVVFIYVAIAINIGNSMVIDNNISVDISNSTQ